VTRRQVTHPNPLGHARVVRFGGKRTGNERARRSRQLAVRLCAPLSRWERSYVSIDERNSRLGNVHGDPGIFGWRESDSMAAYHRHMDETPTIYSMAVIYELP
jgi:hypothetical protein